MPAANILIVFFLKTDLFHYEAMRLIGLYEKRKYRIYIPIIVIIEIITVLTKNGIDINMIRKIVARFKSTDKYELLSLENEELLELALQNACQIKLKSMDYAIFLHYVKFRPEKFESFDLKLLKYINFYENTDKNC